MSGVYGPIDSGDDFFRVLDQARGLARHIVQRNGKNRVLESIDTQLDAMSRWTRDARAPTEDERERILVGVLAMRELEDTGDAEVDSLVRLLYGLDAYFKAWPSDERAAHAKGEFWRDGGEPPA
jgi:ABC-type transporter Mla subunit MlaD